MAETEQQAIDSFNAGLALMRAGRLAEARVCYERAIDIRPDYVRALHNLATLLDDIGEHAAAERYFRAAIAADPIAAEPWAGLAATLRVTGRLTEARRAYERALDLRPEFPAARWNLALIDLAEGRFTEGWANYLFRPSVDRAAVPLAEFPHDLHRTLVEIIDEQGLGDALFFLRFAPALQERGAAISFEPDPRLAGIVERMIAHTAIVPAKATVRVALGDLPFLLGANTCRPPLPVSALPEKLAAAAAALRDAGPPPYTGITWRAGQRLDGWLYKEAHVDGFGAALRDLPGTLINVQRAPEPNEHQRLETIVGRPIADFSRFNDDLEWMLALMGLLDRYIGVSNTNMHLRAAVGRTAQVLVTNPAEYRWMAEGVKSPWFPGFTLYRQAPDGTWSDAFMRLAGDLAR